MLIRIVLADDHPAVRASLRRLLHHDHQMLVVAEAQDGCRALDLAIYFSADVVLMDQSVPVLNGTEATRQLLAEAPKCRVVLMSAHAQGRMIVEAFEAGARGFLAKSEAGQQLVPAIRAVREGALVLSPSLVPALGPFLREGPGSPRGPSVEALRRLVLLGQQPGLPERLASSLPDVELKGPGTPQSAQGQLKSLFGVARPTGAA